MPRPLLILHATWLLYTTLCALALHELRSTILGLSLLLAMLTTLALLATTYFLRRRPPAKPARIPRFTPATIAGLLIITFASFGLVSSFLMDLPNAALLILPGNVPLSRWLFLVAAIFLPTLLYAAMIVTHASGLLHRHEQPKTDELRSSA